MVSFGLTDRKEIIGTPNPKVWQRSVDGLVTVGDVNPEKRISVASALWSVGSLICDCIASRGILRLLWGYTGRFATLPSRKSDGAYCSSTKLERGIVDSCLDA